MRERQRLMVSRQHGVTAHTEIIDDDAGFAQRARELKDCVPPGFGPVTGRFIAVTCNGCGASERLDFDQPQLPGNWITRDSGEFCPACQ
jgi:hypothetical protein